MFQIAEFLNHREKFGGWGGAKVVYIRERQILGDIAIYDKGLVSNSDLQPQLVPLSYDTSDNIGPLSVISEDILPHIHNCTRSHRLCTCAVERS